MNEVAVQELRRVEVFSGLPDDQLAWLAGNGDLLLFKTGETVFRAGDPADSMIVILEGALELLIGIGGQLVPTFVQYAGEVTGLLPFSRMEADGTLVDVITHEMGHVIGIGTIWEDKGLLAGVGTNNPRFTGKNAKRAYGKLRGSGPTAVPVENTGGAGTRDGHWRESVFKNELMSGFISESGNPLSRLTVASLKDLGYRVKLSAAEPYSLPNLQIIAERGLMLTVAPHAHALPVLAPKVLPPDSLNV